MQIIPKKRYSKHKLPGYYYFHTNTRMPRYFIVRDNIITYHDGKEHYGASFKTRLNNMRQLIQDRIGVELSFCTVYRFNSEEDLDTYLDKRKLAQKLCK